MGTTNSKADRAALCRRVVAIAGCCWEDRDEEVRDRPLAEQIREIAATAPTGDADADLTDDDRAALLSLADEAAIYG